MKKWLVRILIMLLTLFTVISPALAWGPSQPCPIALDIITVPPEAAEGLTVVFKYGGVPVAQETVNEYYEVVYDAGAHGCPALEAVILECEENAACHKTVAFNPKGYTKWDITAIEIPCVCPGCPDPVVCPTTTTTITTQPTTTTTTICEDCEECIDCPICPIDIANPITWGTFVTIIIVLGVILKVKHVAIFYGVTKTDSRGRKRLYWKKLTEKRWVSESYLKDIEGG